MLSGKTNKPEIVFLFLFSFVFLRNGCLGRAKKEVPNKNNSYTLQQIFNAVFLQHDFVAARPSTYRPLLGEISMFVCVSVKSEEKR